MSNGWIYIQLNSSIYAALFKDWQFQLNIVALLPDLFLVLLIFCSVNGLRVLNGESSEREVLSFPL